MPGRIGRQHDLSPRQLPRQNPAFEPGPAFTPEVRTVWELCDGLTAVGELVELAGLEVERTQTILRSLRQIGAILLPGETPNELSDRVEQWDRKKHQTDGEIAPLPPREPAVRAHLSPEQREALAEEVELTRFEKLRVLDLLQQVRGGDHYAVLDAPRDASARELKRAYHRMSKEFHPDRHYERELGSFGPWIGEVFEGIAEAFSVLSNPRRRRTYDAGLAPNQIAETPEEHGASLFQRACELEADGASAEALKFFAAAVSRDPRATYLRRAARCALGAGRLGEAEDYARWAASLRPDDPSTLRVLGKALFAAGDDEGAERVIWRAIELARGEDLLVRELHADLEVVYVERGKRAGGA